MRATWGIDTDMGDPQLGPNPVIGIIARLDLRSNIHCTLHRGTAAAQASMNLLQIADTSSAQWPSGDGIPAPHGLGRDCIVCVVGRWRAVASAPG
jgi:hypothetical protein